MSLETQFLRPATSTTGSTGGLPTDITNVVLKRIVFLCLSPPALVMLGNILNLVNSFLLKITPFDYSPLEAGHDVVETEIRIEQLYDADEVFFTSTAAEVTPIREIDDIAIGGGNRGPITEKLQTMYFDAVHGRLEMHPDWLAYV